MSERWSWDEGFDELELEEELLELAEVGKVRKAKKKGPARIADEIAAEDRDDKRRKRRWEAPPHKRISDYEPL